MNYYGEVLDGREAEIVKTLPGKVKVGDLKVRFDGWFVRGDRVNSVKKVGGGYYEIVVDSWVTGAGKHTLRVHANSRVEVIPG